MEEKIKKLDSSLLEIKSIREYLGQFKNYEVIEEDIQNDNGEINILCEGELIRILFINISKGKWWSIYKYHPDGVKYEQIDVITFDVVKENGYNKIIKYSGHIEDDNYSYITCSCFSYLNDEFVSSWKNTRVVPVQDLMAIQYSKSMNLTELIYMTDKRSSNIVKKDDQKNIRTSS